MDILKQEIDVGAVAPEELRKSARNLLGAAASQYRRGKAEGSGFETGTK
jgi:hypothetical protein